MGHFFDAGASTFAGNLDDAIAQGRFHRGRLFVDAARRRVIPGGRVLDYGCGPGRVAKLLGVAGFEVDAVDPSPAMLVEAQKQDISGLRVTFRHYDGTGDALDSAAYDGIVCSSVIEYVSDPIALIANFRRALKIGGILVISYANKLSLVRAYSVLRYGRRMPHLQVQYNVWRFRDVQRALLAGGFPTVSAPVFFEASPFDKRPKLNFLSSLGCVGQLGLVTAR